MPTTIYIRIYSNFDPSLKAYTNIRAITDIGAIIDIKLNTHTPHTNTLSNSDTRTNFICLFMLLLVRI